MIADQGPGLLYNRLRFLGKGIYNALRMAILRSQSSGLETFA